MEHANKKGSEYIDRLPKSRRMEVIQQWIRKYGGGTESNRDKKVQFADALGKFASLSLTKNNVLPYSHVLQSIGTAAIMGGADRTIISTALDKRFDPRKTTYENMADRAKINLATKLMENTETTILENINQDDNNNESSSSSSTSTSSTTTTNIKPTYVIHPTQHTFYGNRNPRKDSHDERGLGAEYIKAWYHVDNTIETYAGKNQTIKQFELTGPPVAVMTYYIERKQMEEGFGGFSVSWQRFKQSRPANVKDSKNRTCMCPHHLQHSCYVTAIHEHRKLIHRNKSNGYGAGVNSVVSCDCTNGMDCPGAKCTYNARDVAYGMTCAVRGVSPDVSPGDCAAYHRVCDLPYHRCYGIDGKGHFCQTCFLDEPTLVNPTLGTMNNIPEEDKDIYRDKIERAIGKCPEEDGDEYDIDVLMKDKITEPKAKGSLKGKTKYAFLPQTISLAKFFLKWTLYVPIFLLHAFTASWQSRQLGGDNGIIREEGNHYATVSIDYSENWTHTLAFEHQSAYWSRSNSTLVPVIVCLDTCDLEPQLWERMQINQNEFEEQRRNAGLPLKIQIAIGFVSEDKLHDKAMSQHIMEDIILWIKKYSKSKTIIVISDGCRSQFKSRHMAGYFATVPKRHGIQFQWHFHCSCHGKCLCDSVGGNWKHLAENAVLSKTYAFPTAKALYLFLQERIDRGLTLWKEIWKTRGKTANYGLGLQWTEMNWIPRSGEVGCVLRGDVKSYSAMQGISTWHRFVATEDGKLYVSNLSCFCKACKDYRFDECPFIADTGKMKLIVPEIDERKVSAKWTEKNSVDMAPLLKKDGWVVWHVSERTKENRDMHWDNDWGLGRFVGQEAGTTTQTDEGIFCKIAPFRTSQLGDGVFIEQENNSTIMVNIEELLLCGLEIKVNVKNVIKSTNKRGGAGTTSKKEYAAHYYKDGDKKGGDLMTIRDSTRNAISIKLERWAKNKTVEMSTVSGGSSSSSSSSSGGGGGGGSSSSSSSSSSNNNFGAENSQSKIDAMEEEEDDTGEVAPRMVEYECKDCGAKSFSEMEILFSSSIHVVGHSKCTKYALPREDGVSKRKFDGQSNVSVVTKQKKKKK